METSDSKEKDLKDEMYDDPNFCDEEGEWQMVFGVVTHPKHQHQGRQATCKHVCKQTIRHSFNCHLRFRLPKTTISCTYIYEIMYFKLRICLPTSTKPFTLMNVKY